MALRGVFCFLFLSYFYFISFLLFVNRKIMLCLRHKQSKNRSNMKLDSQMIVESFSSAVPETVYGVSVENVCEICNISGSTWRKYHLMLRNAEKLLSTNKKKALGFSYKRRDRGIDRTSLLLVYSLAFLHRFFRNEKVAMKLLYQNWEEIKCLAL